MRKTIIAAVSLAVGALLLSQSVFFVPQSQQAVLLELGRPLPQACSPGLNFKLPFVQYAVYLDKRIMTFSLDSQSSYSSDVKRFDIDCYVCWHITDPFKFIKTFNSLPNAEAKLKPIIFAQLFSAIGENTLKDVVGPARNVIMENTLAAVNKKAEENNYGITFVDVRLKRADLPNHAAIFARMNAERARMANEYQYSGEATAKMITSQAELERDIILAQAEKDSMIIRGEADAKAMQIISDAMAAAPEFYEFIKSLEIYTDSFQEQTKIIFSTEDPILKHFQ